METDNDIEQLRRELHEMSAENGGNRHANKNTILVKNKQLKKYLL